MRDTAPKIKGRHELGVIVGVPNGLSHRKSTSLRGAGRTQTVVPPAATGGSMATPYRVLEEICDVRRKTHLLAETRYSCIVHTFALEFAEHILSFR